MHLCPHCVLGIAASIWGFCQMVYHGGWVFAGYAMKKVLRRT